MKIIAPDYYEEFSCKMGECIHTCCAGWQVDIDDETLSFYDTLSLEDQTWVRSHIIEEHGSHFFERKSDGRCAFLRDDGLCEMIIRLGADALCDNCLDHPLFRNYYSDRVEIGLGLCCESACSLILNKKEPVGFLIANDNEDDEISEEDEKFFSFRNTLISIAQDRALSIEERISEISSITGFTMPSIDSFIDFLLTLEYLDPLWHEMLEKVRGKYPLELSDTVSELPIEQFVVYIIYRNVHFNINYALSIIYLFVFLISCFPQKDICEIARIISSEIEYSDTNPARIAEYFFK